MPCRCPWLGGRGLVIVVVDARQGYHEAPQICTFWMIILRNIKQTRSYSPEIAAKKARMQVSRKNINYYLYLLYGHGFLLFSFRRMS